MSPEAKPEQFAVLVRDIPASSDGQFRKEQVDAYFKNIYPETFYKSLVVTENKKSTKSTKSWKTVKRSSDELSYTLTRKKSTPKELYRLTTLAFLASLVKSWIRLNIISNEKIDGLTPKLEAAQKSTIREKQQGADVEFFTSRVTAGAAAQSAHARMIDTWTVMDAP
ncbi:putative 10TM putative phosphate transporter, cytosolic domain-containing protein [Helianthus annuus]|nr:putative 10TM putative phosphate transporter, cytosolic domain-containing protein [Helianthus annuus]